MTRSPIVSAATSAVAGAQDRYQQVCKKVSKRLIGFLFVCFVLSFLDRINIGFAGLTMMGDLGLSGTQFGLASTFSTLPISPVAFPATWPWRASAPVAGSAAL